MYPTLAKTGSPSGEVLPVATDLTVPRMRPTIRRAGPDVSATCHVEIDEANPRQEKKKQPTTSRGELNGRAISPH